MFLMSCRVPTNVRWLQVCNQLQKRVLNAGMQSLKQSTSNLLRHLSVLNSIRFVVVQSIEFSSFSKFFLQWHCSSVNYSPKSPKSGTGQHYNFLGASTGYFGYD